MAWTAILLAAAILVAFVAVLGFLRADDACFFGNGPCPRLGDENFQRLEFAVFGIPLIWLVGVLVGIAGRAWTRHQRGAVAPPRPGRPEGTPPGSAGS